MVFYNDYLSEVLLCKNEKYYLCYTKGKLVVRLCKNKKRINTLRLNSAIRSFSLIERLFRFVPRAATCLNSDEFIISFHGGIYRYSVSKNRIVLEHSFGKGMNNPLQFCVRYENGMPIDVLYGEYIWNASKGPVSIYKRTKEKWEVVFTFPEKTITHIHNIVFDKYRNRYLITTGDEDSESGIWEADVSFKSVNPLVVGSQTYRSCILFPTNDCVFYVTDTPLQRNYVFCLRDDNSVSKVAECPGPCIYGRVINGYLYYSTSVEGDPSLGKWKYRLSYKLGVGVRDRYSHLFRISKHGVVEELGKLKKDFFPMWLFGFGNMNFPENNDDNIYVCPQSLKTKHGTLIIVNRD